MQIARTTLYRPPLTGSDRSAKLPDHEPSGLRDFVEQAAGSITALTRFPKSLVSGLAVGTYQGARKGADANFLIKPESVALGLVTVDALRGITQGLVTGTIMGGGPAGMAWGLLKSATGSTFGLGTFLFIKGGSAAEMGRQVAHTIDANVEPGEGGFRGALHGAAAGTGSAVMSGLSTGYEEGRATASGVLEGLKEVPREFAEAKSPQGAFWRQALSIAGGVLASAFAAPVGLALALLKGKDDEKTVSAGMRYAASGASAAIIGGLSGAVFGPLGIAIGAGVGAIYGLVGPNSKKSFEEKLMPSLERAKDDDTNLGTDIANRRRNMVQGGITGTLNGVRQGWDQGVAAWQPKPPASFGPAYT